MDKISLLNHLENQVENHLKSHLEKLPKEDKISQNIVYKMMLDEKQHADNALKIGAYTLPKPISFLMKQTAKIMNTPKTRQKKYCELFKVKLIM